MTTRTRYSAPKFEVGQPCDLVIASDLHVTANPERGSLEHDTQDAPVHRLLDSALTTLRPQSCLLTGDLTDTGSSDAWRRLEQRFYAWHRERVELMAVAGNHDVHYRRLEVTAERLGMPTLGGYFKNLLASSSTVGACSHPADRTGRRLARLTGRREEQTTPTLHTSLALGADFLLLDSNQRPSSSPASQAIGYVGTQQLEIAQDLLDERPVKRPVYLALHHHVLPPAPGTKAQPFLACLDAREVMRFAEQNEIEAIFHGHLHMPYLAEHSYAGEGGVLKHMRIVSCGSALYPAEGPFRGEIQEASLLAARFSRGKIASIGFVPASQLLPREPVAAQIAEAAAVRQLHAADLLQHAGH